MKRKYSLLHFHGLNMQWTSRWCRLTGPFLLLLPHADCLLTDVFSHVKIMSVEIFFIDFRGRFWTVLMYNLHHFTSHILNHTPPASSSVCAIVQTFRNAPSCSDWTHPLLFEPRGLHAWRWKKHFQVSRTFQWCHKFMKMLFWELFWP